jgi:phosphoglycerate dehydrogenase-like enzyme
MARILVSPRSVTRNGHPSLQRFTDAGYEVIFATPGVQPDEAELLDKLPGCSGFLAGVETVSARVLEAAADTLKVIGRNGVGVDSIDLAAAERLGIQVLAAGTANSRGVAELTIALMLALARSIPSSDAALKAQDWQRTKGIELEGRTLGLVGCGRIGRLVARIAHGLAMTVLAHDPLPGEPPCDNFRYVPLEELLSASDVVSLHCPAPEDGTPVIDAAVLGAMRDRALLINTARAALADGPAVLAALESGCLAGFATDVFETEPPGDDPLALHPKVIATPHIGGYTRESIDRAVAAAVENILNVLQS